MSHPFRFPTSPWLIAPSFTLWPFTFFQLSPQLRVTARWAAGWLTKFLDGSVCCRRWGLCGSAATNRWVNPAVCFAACKKKGRNGNSAQAVIRQTLEMKIYKVTRPVSAIASWHSRGNVLTHAVHDLASFHSNAAFLMCTYMKKKGGLEGPPFPWRLNVTS